MLAMHRIRQQLVKMHTAQANELRGLLAEYGEGFGRGRKAFDTGVKVALERLAERLLAPLIDTLHDQWNEVAWLDERIPIPKHRFWTGCSRTVLPRLFTILARS